jgi:hypothetical protein
VAEPASRAGPPGAALSSGAVGLVQDITVVALPVVTAVGGYLGARLQQATERERVAVERQRLQDERDRLADERAEKERERRIEAYKAVLDEERNVAYLRLEGIGFTRVQFLAALGELERKVDTVAMLASDDATVAAESLATLHRNQAAREETEKARDALLRAIRHDTGVGPAPYSTTATLRPGPR